MDDARPNPDALLEQVAAAESAARRGKLKIFFGYAAGVGKTFAMLQAAQRERAAGVEVVVGYVEPHGRAETEALLTGLDMLPPLRIPYRGVELLEFNLDAALARRPKLILVDELAHSNAEGCRHSKRWQDVQELLGAGIDVYSTLNVQHIESINDVIAKISGVVVHERLPDSVVEQADDLELVDITPEGLIERLKAGKVYLPQQAERAIQNFFQKANLVALRELSFRQAAARLHREVDWQRALRKDQAPWATSDRVLVCIGPSPTTARVVRTAKRLATALDAEWAGVSVDTGRVEAESPDVRERIAKHLRLVEQLGGETHTLVGADVAATILSWARDQNVTKIVVGKTAESWWRRIRQGSVVQRLLRDCGDIDVYVIHGEREPLTPRKAATTVRSVWRWDGYLRAALIVAVCTLVGWLFHAWGLAEANIVMQYLLGVALVAVRYGRGPALAATVASVMLFDIVFVPPYYTIAVSDSEYLLTFIVMLIICILISTLTARLQAQVKAASIRERRTAALYHLTRSLSQISGTDFLLQLAGKQLAEIFRGEVAIYLREPTGAVTPRFGAASEIARHPVNPLVAHWVANHAQVAGAGTDTLPNGSALFVPLEGSQRVIGALGIRCDDLIVYHDPEQFRLLETCAGVIAQAIERDQIALEAHEAKLQTEAERLRNSLLSAVSHDLRTPLAAIAGASSTLIAEHDTLAADTRRELAESIYAETDRLNRLVANLLDMTRLEGGAMTLNKEWQSLEEIIGVVLRRLSGRLANHPVTTRLPPDLPLVPCDDVLIQQVLMNLLENAVKYSPPGAAIDIAAQARAKDIVVEVADRGRGLAPGDEQRVFDKFYRASPGGLPGSVGLGLTICRGILDLHGGRIWAENRAGGGACFRFALPLGTSEPSSAPIAATMQPTGAT
ncbi:MAG: sensor histidine kinase KdpD [Planctomycetia bacterium]|nr:sensor histidine kinase KdpD [Planctomycetia bacterium]